VTATIGTLAGKQTDPVGPPRVKPNRQSARPPVKRTPFDTSLLERVCEHRLGDELQPRQFSVSTAGTTSGDNSLTV
jgi:hypothetical protein